MFKSLIDTVQKCISFKRNQYFYSARMHSINQNSKYMFNVTEKLSFKDLCKKC